MQNTVTLKNIAIKLGVSVSTVSKALNDSYEISKETKKKIVKVANKLNYKPNFYAKSLKKRDKFIFGVIFPNLKDEFYLNVLTGITEESYKMGHLIMVYQTGNKIDTEVNYTQLLSEDIIDGLIFSSVFKIGENKYLQELLEKNLLPIELINKDFEKSYHKSINKTYEGIDIGKLLVNKIVKKITI